MSQLPRKLAEIVTEFKECVGREKLEYLLDYAESLPPFPDWLESDRESMDQVNECMTPVFIYTAFDNGSMNYYFDVPDESPTVRGFAAIMSQGTEGLSPEDVLAIPTDFYLEMGLHQVISHQRLNGLSAILAHMKQQATKYLNSKPGMN